MPSGDSECLRYVYGSGFPLRGSCHEVIVSRVMHSRVTDEVFICDSRYRPPHPPQAVPLPLQGEGFQIVTVVAFAISRYARNDTLKGYVLSFRPQGEIATNTTMN